MSGKDHRKPYNNGSQGKGKSEPITNPRAVLLASKPSLPLPGTTIPPPPGETIDISKSAITSTIADGKYVPPAILATKQGVAPPDLPVFKQQPISSSSNQKGQHYGHQNQGQYRQQQGGGNWASTVDRNKSGSGSSSSYGNNNNKKKYGMTWNDYEEQKKTTNTIAGLSLQDTSTTSSNSSTTTESITTDTDKVSDKPLVEINPAVEKARFERHLARAEQLETIVQNDLRNITRKSDSIYKELCLNGMKNGAPALYSSVSELSNIYIDNLVTCTELSLHANFSSKFVVLRNSVLDLYLSVFGSQNISDSIDVSSPQNTMQTIKAFLAEANSYADSLTNIIVGLKAAPESLKVVANITIRDLLIVLGDVAVHAEKYRLDTRSPIDWTFAMTYYGEAASMMPVNGTLLKSFSSVSQIDGNNFDTAYYLFRSMKTQDPYQARETLLSVFDEVKLRSEKVDSSNFNNFTFQDHRLKFRSCFLTTIGIVFSRVDTDKFAISVEKCRKHLEAMMSILSAEVSKTKTTTSANDGTQIFESEKTVASLTEVGASNIFKYISVLDEDTFKCIVMCLSLLQNIIDKNSLANRMASARYINVTGDTTTHIDGVIDKFLVQFLHSIKCIQGLLDITKFIMTLLTVMTGSGSELVGLHTVAATSRGVSTFLRWLELNKELCIFSVIEKENWEAMERSLGSYISIMNTSRAPVASIQEDHDLHSFIPLKNSMIGIPYSCHNYLCPWGASRGYALDYKSVVIRAARCEASVKLLTGIELVIGSTIGRVAFTANKIGIPYDVNDNSLVAPKDLSNSDKLKMLMVNYRPNTSEDTFSSSSRTASSTAARLVTSSSSSSSAAGAGGASSGNKPRGGRPLIVIDASNLAKYRGDSMPASCKGIKQAIQYYLNGGYKVVTFLPSAFLRSDKLAEVNRFTKLKIGEQGRYEVPNDIYMLNDYIRENIVKGITVNEYNEAYCLVYARKNDAVLVSNDNFREHVKKIEGMQEREEVRAWIRTSTIGYQFQGDYFKSAPINT